MLSLFSCVQLFATLWTIVHQASLSMRFSRQEFWSGLPCSPPGYITDTGIECVSPVTLALQVDPSQVYYSHQGTPSVPNYWKTIALTIQTFVSKVMSLLFNMLLRFAIAFHPRSKHLLILLLHLLPAVILEPMIIKCVTASNVPPSICH